MFKNLKFVIKVEMGRRSFGIYEKIEKEATGRINDVLMVWIDKVGKEISGSF